LSLRRAKTTGPILTNNGSYYGVSGSELPFGVSMMDNDVYGSKRSKIPNLGREWSFQAIFLKYAPVRHISTTRLYGAIHVRTYWKIQDKTKIISIWRPSAILDCYFQQHTRLPMKLHLW